MHSHRTRSETNIVAGPPAILAVVHAASPTSTCIASASLRLRLRTRLILELTFRLRLRLRIELRLGGGVVGSLLVATPGSVHSTFIELQLLIIPQHHIHIHPRPLLFRRFGLGSGLGLGWEGEWLDQFTWPRQAQYMVHFSSSSFSSCHNILLRLRLRLRLGGGVVGSVHVATPGSVHGTFFELQLLIGLDLGLGLG
jgi:hypothetical protein